MLSLVHARPKVRVRSCQSTFSWGTDHVFEQACMRFMLGEPFIFGIFFFCAFGFFLGFCLEKEGRKEGRKETKGKSFCFGGTALRFCTYTDVFACSIACEDRYCHSSPPPAFFFSRHKDTLALNFLMYIYIYMYIYI